MTRRPRHQTRAPAASRPAAAGFTLIELLVATAVAAMLLVVVLSLTNAVLGSYEMTQGRVRQEADAAFLLDALVADLEAVAADGGDDADRLKLSPETASVGSIPDAQKLVFLTRSLDADEKDASGTKMKYPGARKLVTYRLDHKNPVNLSTSGDMSYILFRDVVPAADTFSKAVGKMDIASVVPAADSVKDDDFLAENVVGFSVRFEYLDSAGKIAWTKPADQIRISGYGFWADPGGVFSEANRKSGMPLRAEVSITILSPKGAQLLRNGRPLDEVKKTHARTYTRQTAVFPSGT